MSKKCRWDAGRCKHEKPPRVICELVGDDVSMSFHKVCKENRKEPLWKECSEFQHGSGLVFARIMVNEILGEEKADRSKS